MAYEEKSAWVMALVTLVTYGAYVVVVLGRADGGALTDVAYVRPLLWAIGGSIVASIVLHVFLGRSERDQRDRQIGRFGDHVGQAFLVLGGLAGLVLALVEGDHFWIANVLYLGFTLSAVVGSIARISAYRWGFQPW